MSNNILLFIICYGRVPTYINMVIESIKLNDNIDFIVISNEQVLLSACKNAKNIKCIDLPFEDFKHRIDKMLKNNNIDIGIKMENRQFQTYKICDFRPFFALMYQEFVKDYDFFGWCDLDMIYGNIRKFITDDILDKYNIIQRNGHILLVRNSYVCKNIAFNAFKDYKNKFDISAFKTFCMRTENTWFDEKGFLQISKALIPNKMFKCPQFYDYCASSRKREKFDKILKVENNKIFDDTKEYMYIHFHGCTPVTVSNTVLNNTFTVKLKKDKKEAFIY